MFLVPEIKLKYRLNNEFENLQFKSISILIKLFSFRFFILKAFFVIGAFFLLFFTNFLEDKDKSTYIPKVEKVNAGNFTMQTGYYTGNGSIQTLEGIGFKPDLLIISSENSTGSSAIFKTSAMPDNTFAFFSAAAVNEGNRLVLENDGFTIGSPYKLELESDGFSVVNDANFNTIGVRYVYVAFGGSDCTGSGNFCVGSYFGNGSNPRTISTGFTPNFVTAKRSTAVAANFRVSSSATAHETLFYANTARDSTGNYFNTASAWSGGFNVGGTNNTAGGTYYYFAFKDTANLFDQGTYTGNGADNRSITGIGFEPDAVIVKNATSATNRHAVMNSTQAYGDSSNYLTSNTANLVNAIQLREADGFQVGTDVTANENTFVHYYVAFGGASTPSNASGTFTMKTGTYSGNGSGQTISDLGFSPDLVIIKNISTQQAVFTTSLMTGDAAGYLASATANLTGAIVSMTDNGFMLGADNTVNANTNTYHWQAFGNAYDPITKSGAADFAIGVYYGNGIDNRDIIRLPFQPDMVAIKGNTTQLGVWKPSSLTGDSSLFFSNTTATANLIQAFNSDGFEVGTASNVNAAATLYYWFAFKEGSNFDVATYTGNNTDSRNITTVGFDPELVWVRAATGQYGVHYSDTLSGDTTMYYYNAANVTNRIQGLITNGFQVGTGTEVNSSGVAYHYAAWNKPDPPSGVPGTPGSPTFSNTSSNSVTLSWTSASGADEYKVERALDIGGVAMWFSTIATTSQLSYDDNFLASGQKYWYRVRAVNANGEGTTSSEASVTSSTQTLKMQTGYYVGNGGDLSITGLGFTPDLVFIKSSTTSTAAVFRARIMRDAPNNQVSFFINSADNSAALLNVQNVIYYYIAYGGNDCSASGSFCVGMYSGDGVSGRSISTGFDPNFVTVKRSTAIDGNFRVSSQPANETLFYRNIVRNTSNPNVYIQTLTTGAFTVGTTNNTLGGIYYYFGFKDTANFFKQGTYTADNVDNRSITGVGFKPDFVFVKNATNTTANNTYPVFNSNEVYGDNGGLFTATVNTVNTIQALEADGFQLGTSIYVNGSGTNRHYYAAFGGAPSPSPSGSFKMATGSYSGNDTEQTISGLGFKPDLIMIKDASTNLGVFSTSLIKGDSTAYFSNTVANFDGGIKEITQDGFKVGSNLTVNNNGNTYYWQAFGNAYNPETGTGAADFTIGAIYGNGLDNRNIGRLPFQPDLVVVKGNNTRTGVWKGSNLSGDLSHYYTNTAQAANFIQAINSDGFQIGTGNSVNTAANVYFWFAFKNGSRFSVGNYTGNGGDNRDITGVGFQPDLVWAKGRTTQYGVFKPNNLSGDSTMFFYNAANVTDRIQSLISDGFQVGTNAQVNSNTIVYDYAAWKLSDTVTVASTGTQDTAMDIPSTDNYLGGAFTFVASAGTIDVTQIVISEEGTVNAQTNLSNVDIYYETAGTCTYDGTETLFGTDTTFSSVQEALVTGTMSVGTSQVCVYVVFDIGSGATPTETIEIEITEANDVTLSSDVVTASSWPVQIADTTTLQSAGATLSVDIIDNNGDPVTSPSLAMSSIDFSFDDQISTSTFSTLTEKIRVSNSSLNPQWSISIAADGGPTTSWNSGANNYDFNDSTASAGDGGDSDSFGGQMTFDPSGGTISPEGGCTTTGLTKGGSASFVEGTTDSITLLTAGGSADTNCYWDFTGISASQSVPKEQATGSYALDFTLSIVAN
ncbi:fibronectin type III domain-containing protein [Candidatus Dojkabacteria bacterium]|nr:fibronectin type III domain-containing protein [Candidatus Dojkabacteria bacterium]